MGKEDFELEEVDQINSDDESPRVEKRKKKKSSKKRDGADQAPANGKPKKSKKDKGKDTEKKKRSKKNKDITGASNMTPTMMKKMKEKKIHPIQLHFSDLSFDVKLPKKSRRAPTEWKTILSDITGTFNPGTITAIMGSSGAGKTSLLNVLANRAGGRVDGEILYNGNPKDSAKALLKHQAYVMQDDVMLKTQTPREILQFSANLRLDKSVSAVQKKERVDSLLKELNLLDCQKTQVGAAGVVRGISGGERKRVAIGTELITNPSLLFLDEPTSGLDSFTATTVIETLRELAEAGRTIVCTIHQPNSQIFHKFDQLILLAKGRMVYNGPVADAITYFEELGYPCPEFTNPADFFMKLVHIDQSGGETSESMKRIDSLIEAYQKSNYAKLHREAPINNIPIDKAEDRVGYAQPVLKQSYYLLQRFVKDTVRQPLKMRASIGQSIILGVILGLIYLQVDDDQEGMQNRMGSLYFILVNQGMSAATSVINTYAEEKPIFLRENRNWMYRTTAYYLAKMIADLPFQVVYPTIFSIITYWMIGFQPTFSRFIQYIVILFLCSLCGGSLGLTMSTLAPDASVAGALIPVVLIPFMIFGGFIANFDTIPVFFIWVPYISFIKWGFEALVLNEFRGLTFTCTEQQRIGGQCPFRTGEDTINYLRMEDASMLASYLVLTGMVLFLRLVAYLAILYRAKKSSANA